MDEIIKAIYDSVNTESVPAREIVIPEHGTWAFVSERKLLCYTGVCMKEERPELMLEMSPYYFTGKHSGDRSVKSKINGFFRLDQGAIILDDFIDEIYNGDEKFKRLPIHVKYPTGADTWYGIFQQGEMAEETVDAIERQIFGVTARELENFLLGYAKVFGIYHDYFRYPRLTRYQRGDNYCDLCGMWIPRSFPYLIFRESGQDFSHVSLWGAYRYFQLLLQNRSDTPAAGLLIKNGVEEEVLKRILEAGNRTGVYWRESAVAKDLIHYMYR